MEEESRADNTETTNGTFPQASSSNTDRSVRSSDTSPKDEQTRQKILDIIDHQFDLEVYLKYREIATIRQEITKAESALHDLELAINNAHNLEFENYEKCMLMCGTPVDESEVPLDHPIRSRPVTKPVPINGLQRKKARPTIKVFEEDVDLELDQSGAYESTEQISDRPSEGSKSLPEVNGSAQKTTTAEEEGDNDEKQNEETTHQGENAQPKDEDDNANRAPAVESFAAALSSTEEGGSRFYIKKRVVVGNVSKYIIPEKRDPTLKHFTHKWMIYVVEPPQTQESVSFITGVRFHLHPSYKPHDVVDVAEPPFRLTRLGWGEFPVRIQLHFVDKRRNKSVDVIHHLKLDDSHSGKQMLGSERSIEIELDRNTDFKETSATKPQADSNLPEGEPAAKDTGANTVSINNMMQTVSKQKMSLLQGILKECVRRLPIIRSGIHSTMLPYTCAISAKMYFSWSVGRRKALEWHRAHLLRIEVQQRAFETMDDVLRSAAAALSTKDVVLWCREHRHTPNKSAINLEAEESSGYCKFCGCLRETHHRDYGIANADDNCPRKPKGRSIRRRVGGLSSMTSVTNLLSQLEPGWDEIKEGGLYLCFWKKRKLMGHAVDDMDIDVDASIKPSSSTKHASKYDELFQRIRECSSDEPMDVANERYVDWLWSTVGQLRLNSVVANDMVQARDGSLQSTISDVDLGTAIDQRLVVGNVMAQATRVFLKRILNKSLSIWKSEHDADQCDKMLVPYHVYQAAQQTEEFDFLTNQFMGPPENEEDKNK
ncbi:YEATS domain-containing protein 2 [Apophysomyces sp. BC1034]|nr:YEATS domain-containing protein 2 [Apophysomyces sp. BC1015]KAG0177565.1 YEATS domain-containing protein 2 [Apophysomyces sp. BC1021]KAG0187828.1 YEATS domain-containing protein 2 [Apophysomyces sp. BC1034]